MRQRSFRDVAVGGVLLWGALLSCSLPFGGGGDVAVRIPGLPHDYHGLSVGWHVRWWDGAAVRHRVLDPEESGVPREVAIALSAAGAEVVVVAARARPLLDVQNGDTIVEMKPAGAWGAHPSNRLDISPELGPLAEVLLDAAERGLDPALVNVARLEGEVRRVCRGDPSSLDGARLFDALLSGGMRYHDVSRRARPPATIRLPAERAGAWYSDDASDGPVSGVTASGSIYWTIAVGNGEVRRHWRRVTKVPDPRADGSDGYWEIVTVGRDSDGRAHWYMTPGPTISLPR